LDFNNGDRYQKINGRECGMKVTREKAGQHRAALVKAASDLFQKRGIEGTGVAQISSGAGLTQGAFYSHFRSKDLLAAEACRQVFEGTIAAWRAIRDEQTIDIGAYIDRYLSQAHRDNIETGCPMVAYGGEVERHSEELGREFARGFEDMVGLLEEALRKAIKPVVARERALVLMPAMIGVMMMARAVRQSDRRLSDEILANGRRELLKMALA
jgi:TetR/AcrR family transcriptional repressor of nem operon